MQTVNDSVTDPMFSDKAVFRLSHLKWHVVKVKIADSRRLLSTDFFETQYEY
jgi:hypothetical protein